MSAYISLLRGVNVGGSKIVSSETLRRIYTGLDFSNVRTYLQSGNVVFATSHDDRSILASKIEAALESACGFHVEVFIRQPQEFQRIIANNPFLTLANGETTRLHVSFLYRPPSEAAWGKLTVSEDVADKLARAEQAVYLYYPNGFARAKISATHIEKMLGVPITSRNWNTVNALYKLSLEE